MLLFAEHIASVIGYKEHPEYIVWISLIVSIDVVMAIPFARLRWENKAARFALIKIAGVVVNISLNFIFLYFIPKNESSLPAWVNGLYSANLGVGYVFISNLVASCVTLVLLSGTIMQLRLQLNLRLWIAMMKYSYPLLISGWQGQ